MTRLDPAETAISDGDGSHDFAPRYCDVRALTEELAAPLSPEDQTVQSMPDVSPTKWHRGHTSWFFETFLLERFVPEYRVYHPRFAFIFNSYYETVGPRHPRPQRGLLSRPGVDEVTGYRRSLDGAMLDFLDRPIGHDARFLVDLGLNHEQQHQELVLMDIKHVLSRNPLLPVYRSTGDDVVLAGGDAAPPLSFAAYDGGVAEIGHHGPGFAFDNEGPRHDVLMRPFALATRPVTNGDWLDFMADGGYGRPDLWLSDGWAVVQGEQWQAPLYWTQAAGSEWEVFTLAGPRPVVEAEPVCHVSYYEADAFAHWAGARLPTEAEWEVAAREHPVDGNFLDLDRLHPEVATHSGDTPVQFFGDVWEWTQSPYSPYPGFRPAAGAVGEYNGKFMVNQQVLRGGCCATPPGHTRATYRNFFPPASRWAFSGLRLARDV